MESNHNGDANLNGSGQEQQYAQHPNYSVGMEWGQEQQQSQHQMAQQQPMLQQQQQPQQVQHHTNQTQQQPMLQHDQLQHRMQPQQMQQQHMQPPQQMQQPAHTHPSQPSEYPNSSQHFYSNQSSTGQQFSQGYGDQGYPGYSEHPQFQQAYQQPQYYQGQLQSVPSFSYPQENPQQPQSYPSYQQQQSFAYHSQSQMQYHPSTQPQYPAQYQMNPTQTHPQPPACAHQTLPQKPAAPPAAAQTATPPQPRPRRIQPAQLQPRPPARRSPLLRLIHRSSGDGEGEETVRQVLQRHYNELRQQEAMGKQMQQAYGTQPLHRITRSPLPTQSQSTVTPPSPQAGSSGPAPKSRHLPPSVPLLLQTPPLIAPPSSSLDSQSLSSTHEIARQQHVSSSTHIQPCEGGTLLVPSSNSDSGMDVKNGEMRFDVIGKKDDEDVVDHAAFNRERATTLMAALERANEIAAIKSGGEVETMTAAAIHQAAVVAQNLQAKQQQQQLQLQPVASSSTSRKRSLETGADAPTASASGQGPRVEVNEKGEKEKKWYVLVRHCNQNDEEYNPTGTLKTYDQVQEDRRRDDIFSFSFTSHTAPFELADFRIKKPAGFPNVVPPNPVVP